MANYTAASCGCRVVALSASQLWQKYSPLPCRCRRAKRPLNGDLDLPRFEGQWQPEFGPHLQATCDGLTDVR